MSKARLGYQLLSVYGDASKDLRGTLAKIKKIGYEGVEFIGLFGHGADEIKQMLDELGLTGMSNMLPIDNVLEDPYKVIDECRTLGLGYVSLLVMDPERIPGGARFAATLRDIDHLARLMNEAGIQLLYHHHGAEFAEFSGQTGLDFILDVMPEGMLCPELDCYWVHHAGNDPAQYIRKYSGRCDIVHLKDNIGYKEGAYRPEGADESVPFELVPLGAGQQDIPSQLCAADEAGVKWIIVEQEVPSPNRTQYEAAKLSYEYLKGHGY